jgi:hypothetical protein
MVSRWASMGLFWAALILVVGYLSIYPTLQVVADEDTEIKLVIRSSGKLLGECVEVGSEALAKLSPNMRRPIVCPREKSDLTARLTVNGTVYFERSIAPSGIHHDGVIAAFTTLRLPAGPVTLQVSIKDDQRHDGWTHQLERQVSLRPDRILTVHFTDLGISLSGV